MSFFDTADTKGQNNFINKLAFTTIICSFLFLAYCAFFLSKKEVQDNTMLIQIVTGILQLMTLILAFYYGSSSNSRGQQQQITEMHKDATTLAMKAADKGLDTKTSEQVEVKIDKAVAIQKLKDELTKHPVDSEEAKKLIDEIEALEKSDK